MGRKDAAAYSLPVESYRKNIGKHNKKQTKVEIRQMKMQSEVKSSSDKFYKDFKFTLTSCLAIIGLGYLILHLWLFQKY